MTTVNLQVAQNVTVASGNYVTYMIRITNPSIIPALGVNIRSTNELPGQYTSIISNPRASNITLNGQGFIVNYAIIAPFTTVTINAIYQINDTVSSGTYNNIITIIIPVSIHPKSLTVTKTANQSTVNPNDIITYTITVNNSGQSPITNVTLTDINDLPGQFTNITVTMGSVSNITSLGNSFTANPDLSQPSNLIIIEAHYQIANDASTGTYNNTVTLTGPTQPPVTFVVTVSVV